MITHQIIWFLAPTVALATQQFHVIQLQIPAMFTRLLTGQDGVDAWSGTVWQLVLKGVRIVVSTYQVLLDALCHAFVFMDHVSLLVFDEGKSTAVT